MRFSIKILATTALTIIAIALATTPAAAQLNSLPSTVTINATLPEALTLNLTNPTITITLAANTAANVQTTPAGGSVITTAWVLGPTRTSVKVFIFSASATPLSNGTDTIPLADIKLSNTGIGGTYNALSAATPFGTGLQIGPTTTITNANRSSSRTDTVFFEIDTTFNPQLSAGLYTGTLSVQAQALP